MASYSRWLGRVEVGYISVGLSIWFDYNLVGYTWLDYIYFDYMVVFDYLWYWYLEFMNYCLFVYICFVLVFVCYHC